MVADDEIVELDAVIAATAAVEVEPTVDNVAAHKNMIVSVPDVVRMGMVVAVDAPFVPVAVVLCDILADDGFVHSSN